LKTTPAAIRAQSFAEIRHFFRDDFRILPHEPKTPGMKIPERLLRQGKFRRRNIQRDCFGLIHAYLITQTLRGINKGKQMAIQKGSNRQMIHVPPTAAASPQFSHAAWHRTSLI
jgi:hypothetical protein